MGSPRRLREVLSETPLPVSFSSSSIRSYQRGLYSRSSTWAREVPSSWTTSPTRSFQPSLTSKVKVMKGLGWPTLSICDATVSSIEGQKGLPRSRNLICSLIRSATPGTLGQPMMERPPRAGGAIFVDELSASLLPAFIDLEGESQEGAGMFDLEQLRRDGIEHRGAEGSPALAELDLLVDTVGHTRHAGAANDGAAAEGARTELHTPLEPGDRVAIDHDFGDALGDVVDLLPHRLVGVAGAGSND